MYRLKVVILFPQLITVRLNNLLSLNSNVPNSSSDEVYHIYIQMHQLLAISCFKMHSADFFVQMYGMHKWTGLFFISLQKKDENSWIKKYE